ncbi:hypothetical protein AHAS_Ahas10G0133000 [Arachis hypogaea]
MLTTHFTEISVDMLALIGCIMEAKKLYIPRLIRKFMWRAHVRGTLPFPTLVTEMAQGAVVPWLQDDESPPPVHEKERAIPWGTWVNDKSPVSHHAQASTALTLRLSSSTAAAPRPSAPPIAPPAAAPPLAPQPTYRLV